MRTEPSRNFLHHGTDLRFVGHVAIEAFDPIRNVRRRGNERAIDDRYPIYHLVGEQRTHDSETESAGTARYNCVFHDASLYAAVAAMRCAAWPNFIAYLAKGIADRNLIRKVHFPDVPLKFPVRISKA
jgi:hypothetical protein